MFIDEMNEMNLMCFVVCVCAYWRYTRSPHSPNVEPHFNHLGTELQNKNQPMPIKCIHSIMERACMLSNEIYRIKVSTKMSGVKWKGKKCRRMRILHNFLIGVLTRVIVYMRSMPLCDVTMCTYLDRYIWYIVGLNSVSCSFYLIWTNKLVCVCMHVIYESFAWTGWLQTNNLLFQLN